MSRKFWEQFNEEEEEPSTDILYARDGVPISEEELVESLQNTEHSYRNVLACDLKENSNVDNIIENLSQAIIMSGASDDPQAPVNLVTEALHSLLSNHKLLTESFAVESMDAKYGYSISNESFITILVNSWKKFIQLAIAFFKSLYKSFTKFFGLERQVDNAHKEVSKRVKELVKEGAVNTEAGLEVSGVVVSSKLPSLMGVDRGIFLTDEASISQIEFMYQKYNELFSNVVDPTVKTLVHQTLPRINVLIDSLNSKLDNETKITEIGSHYNELIASIADVFPMITKISISLYDLPQKVKEQMEEKGKSSHVYDFYAMIDPDDTNAQLCREFNLFTAVSKSFGNKIDFSISKEEDVDFDVITSRMDKTDLFNSEIKPIMDLNNLDRLTNIKKLNRSTKTTLSVNSQLDTLLKSLDKCLVSLERRSPSGLGNLAEVISGELDANKGLSHMFFTMSKDNKAKVDFPKFLAKAMANNEGGMSNNKVAAHFLSEKFLGFLRSSNVRSYEDLPKLTKIKLATMHADVIAFLEWAQTYTLYMKGYSVIGPSSETITRYTNLDRKIVKLLRNTFMSLNQISEGFVANSYSTYLEFDYEVTRFINSSTRLYG